MLLSALNSNLRPGSRIQPKSGRCGISHEEGVPILLLKPWCGVSCKSNDPAPIEAEIRPGSRPSTDRRPLGAQRPIGAPPGQPRGASVGPGCGRSAPVRLRPPRSDLGQDSCPTSGSPDLGPPPVPHIDPQRCAGLVEDSLPVRGSPGTGLGGAPIAPIAGFPGIGPDALGSALDGGPSRARPASSRIARDTSDPSGGRWRCGGLPEVTVRSRGTGGGHDPVGRLARGL